MLEILAKTRWQYLGCRAGGAQKRRQKRHLCGLYDGRANIPGETSEGTESVLRHGLYYNSPTSCEFQRLQRLSDGLWGRSGGARDTDKLNRLVRKDGWVSSAGLSGGGGDAEEDSTLTFRL